MPGRQLFHPADFQGLLPAKAKERSEQASASGPHASEGARSGPTSQAQEYLFGLVVQGVAEQDRATTQVVGGRFQGSMTGIPGGGLGPETGGSNFYGAHFHR